MTDPTDEELGGYVEALAARVPEVDAPLTTLLARSRAAARRRARRRSLAAAAAVALAVVAIAVVPRMITQDAGAPAVPPAAATPSAGTRLVGAGGVAIAVPASWSQVSGCALPTRPYYHLSDGGSLALTCRPSSPSPQVSGLEIDTGDDWVSIRDGHPFTRTLPTGQTVDGVSACSAHDCSAAWTVDARVTFLATLVGPDKALLDQMTASIRVLPRGLTTVPLWPLVEHHPGLGHTSSAPTSRADYLARLRRAGLTGRLDVGHDVGHDGGHDGGLRRGGRVTDPAQGQVVPRGSTVVVR